MCDAFSRNKMTIFINIAPINFCKIAPHFKKHSAAMRFPIVKLFFSTRSPPPLKKNTTFFFVVDPGRPQSFSPRGEYRPEKIAKILTSKSLFLNSNHLKSCELATFFGGVVDPRPASDFPGFSAAREFFV